MWCSGKMTKGFSRIIFGIFVVALLMDIASSDYSYINAQANAIREAAESMQSSDPLCMEMMQSLAQKLLNFALFDYDIGYYLFTRSNPQERYRLQVDQNSLDGSPFNSSWPLKFLIHGYSVVLPNTSVMYDIKDALLLEGNYNVFVVNWTLYNQGSYIQSSVNAVFVGLETAGLIEFLKDTTGIEDEDVHLIGHSLGAQVAAFAGEATCNLLGRITGLDAAGPIFEALPNIFRLDYTDAMFVDAIHTSGALVPTSGYGTLYAYADQDFFPNGGSFQPGCEANDTFLYTDKTEGVVNSSLTEVSCSHDRAPFLFWESINDSECSFWSVLCSSYQDFEDGQCLNQSTVIAEMGFHAKPIPNLEKEATFYLKTHSYYPYCIEGYIKNNNDSLTD